jgi:SAM-dependent methyltransferase
VGLREYDLIADWYASTRGGAAGTSEVASLAASLGEGALVLDAGCGTGLPLARLLRQHGCRPIGLDSSAAMIARFGRNLPGVPAVRARLQACPIADRTLHAVVAWGVMFHLDHREQREAVAEVSRVLRPGGLFLFTSGDAHGSKDGEPMDGVPFRYHSFSVEGYRELLAARGLALEDVHADAGGNTHYLARKA